MPVIVKFTCRKCRGEADIEGVRCIACSMHDLIKSQGGKYFPSLYNIKNKECSRKKNLKCHIKVTLKIVI
jgi:hypothetical protein